MPNRVTETDCRNRAMEYRVKFSESLYNNTVDTLRHIFDLAIKRGLIARNPAASIEKVKITQKKLELPSGDQFRRIVALIRDAGSAVSDTGAVTWSNSWRTPVPGRPKPLACVGKMSILNAGASLSHPGKPADRGIFRFWIRCEICWIESGQRRVGFVPSTAEAMGTFYPSSNARKL